MIPSETVIDEIVHRVLQQLSGKDEKPCATDDELILHEPVISAALLGQRLNGARRVAIAPGAVITPAARDVLRQYEVDVRTSQGQHEVPATPVAIGIVASGVSPTTLRELSERAAIAANFMEACELSEMINKLGDYVIRQQALGVLLTEQPAAALCVANRRAGIRAVQAEDVPSMRCAVAAVGANLLAVNPRGLSSASLIRVMQEFVAGGPYACPEGLRSDLN
ncbi:MAG: hypothetical protein OES79_11640 [Planctomycetota bacterium]|nr:hypothetical protein [Planctomycetota bacterium]